FIPVEDGGILTSQGVVDVFFNLRAPDEASFAGGVFIIVKCENEKVWELLGSKGHLVSRNGKYACMYLPYHYMGLETPVSIILGDFMGIGSHPECRQVSVLTGVAERELAKGTVLKVEGHHHSIDGLIPELLICSDQTEDIVPFYLLNDLVLTRDVKEGETITLDAVDISKSKPYKYYVKSLEF
ncbi:MAG TPA: homoserine dehydrogenase, partial [Clostridiaceae bacterium]|nr:homoserine dehydrogenase [Clostridiaceae bacterium]